MLLVSQKKLDRCFEEIEDCIMNIKHEMKHDVKRNKVLKTLGRIRTLADLELITQKEADGLAHAVKEAVRHGK